MPSPTLSPTDELHEIDKTLRAIDNGLRKLNDQMVSLQERARRLRDRRRLLAPSVSWIDRLPPDILAQIMLRGTQSIGASNVNLVRDRVLLPVAVSQVNRRWRGVALQLASLWTYINMDEGRPYNRTILWLKRSRNLPLDIDLDWREMPPEMYYQRNFLIALNVLIPHIHRWASIRLLAPAGLIETGLHVFSAPAPLLHTLVLKGWSTEDADDNEDHWAPTIFCRQTPRLQSVHLHSVGLKWDTCMFSEMRDVTLSWIPGETIFNLHEFSRFIGNAAPCLRRLVIIGSSPRAVEDTNVESLLREVLPIQVTLPRMQELRLEAVDLLDVQTFIPLLNAPNLRKLVLSRIIRGPGDMHGGVDIESWRRTDWRPHLDRLDHLELNNVEFDSRLIEAIAKSAPGIRKLDVRGPSATPIVEYLTPEPLLMLPEEDALMPKLELLEVHDARVEAVLAFVDARTKSLREVKGSVMNDRRLRKATSGKDALRQLGWEHNDAVHVAISPVM